MIVLFTDYGGQDPYVGQIKALLAERLPGCPVIDLLHAVPDFNTRAAAHLLDALVQAFPVGSLFLCVVDPEVGTSRGIAVLQVDGRWYVGPDNGLMSVLVARASERHVWQVPLPNPPRCATFHGRDVFAPIAIQIVSGHFDALHAEMQENLLIQFEHQDLPEVIFIDHYGNLWTGIRGEKLPESTTIRVNGLTISWHRTFADADQGALFWYVNSAGLVEIAANRASAAEMLKIRVGALLVLMP